MHQPDQGLHSNGKGRVTSIGASMIHHHTRRGTLVAAIDASLKLPWCKGSSSSDLSYNYLMEML
jgi:hypothetical protein